MLPGFLTNLPALVTAQRGPSDRFAAKLTLNFRGLVFFVVVGSAARATLALRVAAVRGHPIPPHHTSAQFAFRFRLFVFRSARLERQFCHFQSSQIQFQSRGIQFQSSRIQFRHLQSSEFQSLKTI